MNACTRLPISTFGRDQKSNIACLPSFYSLTFGKTGSGVCPGNRLRDWMFAFIVLFIFIGNGYFAFMVFATEDSRIERIAVVLQSFGIIPGLIFFIYAYFDSRISRELIVREKIEERFENSQQTCRNYVVQLAAKPELGLFNYLPEDKRTQPEEVHRAHAFVCGVLFIEQGLHGAKILHDIEVPDLESWMLFGTRLSEQEGFREFFAYISDRFSPLVAAFFERIHGCTYSERPEADINMILAKTS
ncbi:MAG: hypothetical protein KJP02_02090 [Octadecabacter sp.]|nr:hypothetical protein [Octadecabacter sp.]